MENKQSELSKQWIIEALFTLMETKPFEKITVTDITNKAGVARLTFYRHFESKEQIILAYFDFIVDSYINEYMNIEELSPREAISSFFEYWRLDEKRIRLLIKNNLIPWMSQYFERYFNRIFPEQTVTCKTSYFQRKFVEAGFHAVLVDWILDPKGYTASEMADMILDLVHINLES